MIIIIICFSFSYFSNFSLAQEEIIFYTAFTNNDMSEVQYWSPEGVKTQNLIFNCAGNLLYGGYGIFGEGAKISKQFKLPPHSEIKVNVDVWKLDDWYQEYIQIIIDEYVYHRKLYYSEGSQLCGLLDPNENELIIPIEISIPHSTELLNINILSTLNESPSNESWGIRNFSIKILTCPNSCTICDQETAQICSIISIQQITIDEWFNYNNNEPIQSTACVAGINIIGGYGILDKNSVLTSKINLPTPHYKIRIKFQLFLIDISSLNNSFILEIGDLIKKIQLISTSQFSLCGSSLQESIKNIDESISHSNNNLIVKISPVQLNGEDLFWGIISFNLFIIKCSDEHCVKCIEKDSCLECMEEWVLENNKCNRLQNPVQISQIKVKQIQNILVNLEQELENQSIILNKTQTFMELTVTFQCNKNNFIQSNFIICFACKEKNIVSSQFQCQFMLDQMITFSIKLEKFNITSEELILRSIIFPTILQLKIKMKKTQVQQSEIIQITKLIRYSMIIK